MTRLDPKLLTKEPSQEVKHRDVNTVTLVISAQTIFSIISSSDMISQEIEDVKGKISKTVDSPTPSIMVEDSNLKVRK